MFNQEESLSRVSVIIPVYNTAEFLSRCLNSVLNSTYSNLEVICVNDGSTDNSLSILTDFVRNDDRVKIINKYNGGVSSARNAGLDAATGDYVAFIDSDDWIHSQYFEFLMRLAKENEADVVVCSELHSDKKIEEKLYTAAQLSYRPLRVQECTQIYTVKRRVWGRVYKKALINNIRFDDTIKFGEDTVYNLTAICSKKNIKVIYLELPLYFYYERSDSAVHKLSPDEILNMTAGYWKIIRENKVGGDNKDIILVEAIKSFLAWRFLTAYQETDERRRYISVKNNLYIREIKKSKLLVKWRVIYSLFIYFPFLYRWYRIHDDPTLLKYEKSQQDKIESKS